MESPSTADVLIVGGGMAGLTAAAYLSRGGLQVLLCEKETKAGGLVSSFEHNGFVFDGGIRAIENSGTVLPMLRQLGIQVDFLPSTVSIGIGRDVIRIRSADSLRDYQELLEKHFPENRQDIATIVGEIRKIMGYMDVLYGVDNPLFLDLKSNPQYALRTILPWMLKYLLTMPKLGKLYGPVDEYLARFTRNRALIDLIAQHFFRKTPAFFALAYFSLYLDYRYPRGGTGSLARAVERFALDNGGLIRTGVQITSVNPGRHEAVDAQGRAYRYRKLLWAADAKTLYRILDLGSVVDSKALTAIKARQQAVSDKVGGDSVFTVYLALDLDKSYFDQIASAHFFYTPSVSGLSHAALDALRTGDRSDPAAFVQDRAPIAAWLQRYLDLTTYEVSCPALRDARLAPEGQTGLIVSSLFDYALTKRIRDMGWYEEFGKLVSEHIVQVLDASIFPGIKAAVMDSLTSTPLTLERISGNSEGAITGWAFTNKPMPAVNKLPQVASSVLTPIPDTYQAGQWTFSPSGLPISILTGKLAADRILKELG
jgi:phytoene dehydrogenase-like protein